MNLKSGYTSQEAAAEIAINWLKAAAEGKTKDVDMYAYSSDERAAVRYELVQLHQAILKNNPSLKRPIQLKRGR